MRLLKLYKVAQGWISIILLSFACVDPIVFEVPAAASQLIVEGVITNAPAPYTVKLTNAVNVSDSKYAPRPVLNARITLFDDEGNSEDLVELGNGEYITSGLIQGRVGHVYNIQIVTDDGKIFESEPDVMSPAGTVTDIQYEFEARTKVLSYGEFKDDVFNIYVDSEIASTDGETFVRWEMTGIYKVETSPHLHMTWLQGENSYMTPLPCSGYIVVPPGKLEQQRDCTCCTCWAKHYEQSPNVSDNQLISGSEFRHVKVGEVPVNNATFYDKYLVVVDQFSLSRNAFNFFSLVKKQKEGASSLFQPPSAEIKGNIKSVNHTEAVAGLFYASAVSQKTLFITKDKVPYNLPPIDLAWYECYAYYRNASPTKPDLWKE